MTAADRQPVLSARDVSKTFRDAAGRPIVALDKVSIAATSGTLTALVGPDGAGKTTLLRLATGLLSIDGGALQVLGINVKDKPAQVQARVGYMPQRFGLYDDLSVQENLDLYADMHSVSSELRRTRYPRLLDMTALQPFRGRLVGRLSGGMKQKLALACTLLRAPELLLLDEPTVGVDPLSRRELWTIIRELVQTERQAVLLSTAYLDEAERCDHAIVLHEGRVLAQGVPSEVRDLAFGRTFTARPPGNQPARGLQALLLDSNQVIDAVPEAGEVRFVGARQDASAGTDAGDALEGCSVALTPARFEDGFMALLRDGDARERANRAIVLERAPGAPGSEVMVEVRDLVRKFGSFTAVDHIAFEVRRGEVFGLLGPNGAGKTTTFRMLCGLLPATHGTLRVGGVDLRSARAEARQRIGYVAQKFSLYGQLTVAENLEFFASAYGLRGKRKQQRTEWAMNQFDLGAYRQTASEQLPGGFKRRLAMAAALLHEPDTLFLDEPTSGADPMARREFWRGITSLAEQGVTIIVTTHFMEEAEYCDRVVILDQGAILVEGTPLEIRRSGELAGADAPGMEAAFVALVAAGRVVSRARSHPMEVDQ